MVSKPLSRHLEAHVTIMQNSHQKGNNDMLRLSDRFEARTELTDTITKNNSDLIFLTVSKCPQGKMVRTGAKMNIEKQEGEDRNFKVAIIDQVKKTKGKY
jgi:hypothetical protein